jgi:LPS export ABC transporter protein LptC
MRAAAMLIAAAALAAAACRDGGRVPTTVNHTDAALDSADQVMFTIATVITDRGLMRAQLRADTALFFDDNQRIELRGVTTTFFDATGKRTSVLTSREGTYNTRQQETEARKDVVVVSDDGRRLETQQLKYHAGRDEISSDSAFVLTEPGRRLTGIGFISDPDMRNVRVLKNTTAEGTFTLPGQ